MAKLKSIPLLFWAFVPPLVFLLLILGQKWIPAFDTLYSLMEAHYTISNFAATGEIPLWSPYMSWGQPTSVSLMRFFSPSLFVTLPFAKLFPAVPVPYWLYVSAFIDEWVLICGCLLLGKKLFRSPLSTLLVTVSLWGTSTWYSFLHLHLHLYYALPLCFFLLMEGYERRSPWRLALAAAIFCLTGAFGVGVYNALIQAGCLAVFFLLLFRKPSGKKLENNYRTWVSLGLLALIVAIPLILAFHGGRVQVMSVGRGGSGTVSYQQFLAYGPQPNFPRLLQDIFGGYIDRNTNFYPGITSLLFFTMAILFSAPGTLTAFLGLGGVLFLFAMGGHSFLAPLTYYIPGMPLFRHLWLVTPLVKMCLIFVAGWGWDQYLAAPKKANNACLTISLILVGLFITSLALSPTAAQATSVVPMFFLYGVMILFFIRQKFQTTSQASWILAALCIVDVCGFRSTALHREMLPASAEVWNLFKPRALEYQPTRQADYFSSARFSTLFELVDWDSKRAKTTFEKCFVRHEDCAPVLKTVGELYNTTEQFLSLDVCTSRFVSPTALPAVVTLHHQINDSRVPASEAAKQQIGCAVPKARVVDSSFVNSRGEARVESFTANSWTISAHAKGPGNYLYLADAWHPFWTAEVNGQAVAIEKARDAFKAIPIPAGESRIHLRFNSLVNKSLLYGTMLLSFLFIFGIFSYSFASLRESA